jgi:hypothetical protein
MSALRSRPAVITYDEPGTDGHQAMVVSIVAESFLQTLFYLFRWGWRWGNQTKPPMELDTLTAQATLRIIIVLSNVALFFWPDSSAICAS